jgi:FtsP/CotA-like multicopper oxidase with cupredoxin domain
MLGGGTARDAAPKGALVEREVDRPVISRRSFIRAAGALGLGFVLVGCSSDGGSQTVGAVPGGDLDLSKVDRFVTPVLIPPVMPRAGLVRRQGAPPIDYYEISMRQLEQQVLPEGLPRTTVWGYGPVAASPDLHNAPSLTIEARRGRPVRVKWVNDLVSEDGAALPHLLPVDPTLHWANPPGGDAARDTRPTFEQTPGAYTGPVPIVTHVHGAVAVGDESDGYAEAWFLPDATDIPDDYATVGTWYDFFAAKAENAFGVPWGPGFSVSQYPNGERAGTKWYHDHTLGMTRLNVYAGPAGFYLLREDDADGALDGRSGKPARLPGPAPQAGDEPGVPYREIPLAIQDRAFNADGSLFYPDSRAYFDGIVGPYLPLGGDGHDEGHGGDLPMSEGFSPIWNPEFFGNTIIVNGRTWPFLEVEQVRYRLRLLNGCQSRFLILDFSDIPDVQVWQIGNDGGLLDAPVHITADARNRVLLAPAERADVIVDFQRVPPGQHELRNLGPDEPFGGGEPGDDFPPADPQTTGQVMAFRVTRPRGPDRSTPPQHLQLPVEPAMPDASLTRPLALMEIMGMGEDEDGEPVDGPTEAVLGQVVDNEPQALEWMSPVTENPMAGDTEIWEFYNTTADAHPMHIHEVIFEVVEREGLVLEDDGETPVRPLEPDGQVRPPEPWESGRKDTVIAYPGQVTRVKATFGTAGQYVWHCHIVEHEDNEMMRPFRVGPEQPGQPMPDGGM